MFPAKMLTLLRVPLLHDVGSRVLVSHNDMVYKLALLCLKENCATGNR